MKPTIASTLWMTCIAVLLYAVSAAPAAQVIEEPITPPAGKALLRRTTSKEYSNRFGLVLIGIDGKTEKSMFKKYRFGTATGHFQYPFDPGVHEFTFSYENSNESARFTALTKPTVEVFMIAGHVYTVYPVVDYKKLTWSVRIWDESAKKFVN